MTDQRNTKRAMLVSAISILLCAALLIGSTFAWFTDTDTTAVSNVVSGTLDIEIVDEDGNEKTDAFKFVNADGSSDIKWEPGATFRTEGFQIKNVGNLWLKYKVEINNTEVSHNKLNEVIDFYLVKADGTKLNIKEMKDIALAPSTMNTEGVMYIEGHMDEKAGNEYQGITLNGVSITVYAAQYTSEKDKDDDQYDKDAVYPVADSDELKQAVSNAKPGTTVQLGDGTYSLDAVNPGVVIAGNGAGSTTIDVGTGLQVNQENITISGAAIAATGNSPVIKANKPGMNVENVTINANNGAIWIANGGETTVSGSTLTAGYKAIEVFEGTDLILVEDCTIDAVYPVNVNSNDSDTVLEVKNSTLLGWTSYGKIKSASFTDVTFGKGHGYAYLRPFTDTTLTGCDFMAGFQMGYGNATDKHTITLTDCTYNGSAITADNIIGTLVSTADSPDYGYMKENVTLIVNGVTVRYQ